MKKFEYVVKDEVGIHARPAGLLVKEAKKYESKITISKDGKSAEATKLMAVMGLGVKCGQSVEVSVEGGDEDAAFEGIKAFFESNL
ncbi:MAG: HPr family phosphocarrier protein [Lachnospiraceae bacterium]|mgnify:FL=1|nr:HPr family phosphocarrier protein [Lachnospiraceae bacterium]